MAKCEQCGNDYQKPLEITFDGKTHIYDCFECAITAMAPSCAHCGCRVIGHGVDQRGQTFCCHHCAQAAHVTAAS